MQKYPQIAIISYWQGSQIGTSKPIFWLLSQANIQGWGRYIQNVTKLSYPSYFTKYLQDKLRYSYA